MGRLRSNRPAWLDLPELIKASIEAMVKAAKR